MKILIDYPVSWIQQEFIPPFDMQNPWNQYWLRKKNVAQESQSPGSVLGRS